MNCFSFNLVLMIIKLSNQCN